MNAVQTLSALTYNAHLFGRTATFAVDGVRRETNFYFHDAERLPQIIGAVRDLRPDLVGFTEIWDEAAGTRLRKELSEVYPYAAFAPSAPGIGPVLEKTYRDWPRLAPRIDNAVGMFTRRHYSVAKTGPATASSSYEDLMGRALSTVLRSGPVWGAGLLFLSRFPIEQSFFLPHPLRADWEHLARKGVLWSTVRLPDDRLVRVSLGHYQEGESVQAIAARRQQILRTRGVQDFFGGPTLAMGDFNVIGGTPEHAWMVSALSLHDPGNEPTYRDPNPYQFKLKGRHSDEARERRLDYILHSAHWRLSGTSVPRKAFLGVGGAFYLSDHDPVVNEYALD